MSDQQQQDKTSTASNKKKNNSLNNEKTKEEDNQEVNIECNKLYGDVAHFKVLEIIINGEENIKAPRSKSIKFTIVKNN